MDIDIVITYCNIKKHELLDINKKYNINISDNRCRDFGWLKYVLRSIETNIPYIRKVHLVVSDMSQVPEYINKDIVNVVLHKDIIPEEFLPTYNSTTIEMFLHKINGLAEHYIYFNDDMFAMDYCPEEFFVKDGKVMLFYSYFEKFNKNSEYYNHIKNCCTLTGIDKLYSFNHLPNTFIKSIDEKFYEKNKDEILSRISITRTKSNLNQYVYLMNYISIGDNVFQFKNSIDSVFSLDNINYMYIYNLILTDKNKLIVINDDIGIKNINYIDNIKQILLKAFEKRFPNKSKYEI